MAIQSFADKETQKVYWNRFSKKIDHSIQTVAYKKLRMLDEADTIMELRELPGNHLEALKGERKGQHSIRVNDQYRLCFVLVGSELHDVEIVDYH